MKRRQNLVAILAVALLLGLSSAALAAGSDDKDTATRLVSTKVVEVTDARISVITRTGVEHVIAVDDAGTKVILNGKEVALKDLREGDVVTVELDEVKPVKFAKNIEIAAQASQQVAKAKP